MSVHIKLRQANLATSVWEVMERNMQAEGLVKEVCPRFARVLENVVEV